VEKRPTVAIIDRSAIRHNFAAIEEKVAPPVKVMAVVKADAYGHGAVEVAKVLEAQGCGFFGVALCEEGIALREARIEAPVIVLAGLYPDQVTEVVDYDLTPVIFDTRCLSALDDAARQAGKSVDIHLKVDTGMGRLGLLPTQVAPFLEELKEYDHIRLAGLLSHFSEAEEREKSFSRTQIDSFTAVLKVVRDMGYDPVLSHMANSAAAVDLPASHFNLIRAGIMLYGAYPAESFKEKIELIPAMEVKTEIIQLKRVPKGFPVSYGRSYVTDRETLVATIPIGYGDGYSRSLSGSGQVLVGGRRAPVIGKVCMDLSMVDVTGVEGVKVGDEVVLLGRQGEEMIDADEIAAKMGTISYEVFCNISARVPRVYR